MTDPYEPDLVPGWGPPPEPPRAPRRALVPLAVVIVVALVAAVVAVASKDDREVGSARPSPVATRSPRAKAKPQPVRTYSAPPDGIPVTGRVVDVNGRPVRGAGVELTRHEGFFEGLGRALAAVATLGVACLAGDVCTVPFGEGRTDSAGRYTVYLEHDVDDYDLVVTPREGLTFSARIDFAGKGLKLPDVVHWDPAPRGDVSGTRARVRFAAPPSRLGAWRGATATVADDAGNPLFPLGSIRSGETFDARLIESQPVTVSVSVSVRTRLGDATYAGTSPEFRGRLLPMTRGKPCVEYAPRTRPVRTASCDLTDGDLVTKWQPKMDTTCQSGQSCDRSVAVDLGAVRRITYVVVRGCDSSHDEVSSSVDGKTWRVLIPEGFDSRSAVSGSCVRAVDRSARYLRVSGPFPADLTEMSAF